MKTQKLQKFQLRTYLKVPKPSKSANVWADSCSAHENLQPKNNFVSFERCVTSVGDVYLAIASNFCRISWRPPTLADYKSTWNTRQSNFILTVRCKISRRTNLSKWIFWTPPYWNVILSFVIFWLGNFWTFLKKSFEKGWKYFFLNFSLLQKCSVDHQLSFDVSIEA